jgi:uncharacterized membrane protein YjfL (UPF0719 family)
MSILLDELLATVAFAAVGMVLLAAGYAVVDLLTPGRLGQLVFVQHRRDASVVLAGNLVALGAIVATAIYTAESSTWYALAETVAFGVIGIALLGVAFLVLDLLTPGKLGVLVTDESDDPAVWVILASQLAIGLVVSASLT